MKLSSERSYAALRSWERQSSKFQKSSAWCIPRFHGAQSPSCATGSSMVTLTLTMTSFGRSSKLKPQCLEEIFCESLVTHHPKQLPRQTSSAIKAGSSRPPTTQPAQHDFAI